MTHLLSVLRPVAIAITAAIAVYEATVRISQIASVTQRVSVQRAGNQEIVLAICGHGPEPVDRRLAREGEQERLIGRNVEEICARHGNERAEIGWIERFVGL